MKKAIFALFALTFLMLLYIFREPTMSVAYATLYKSPCDTPISIRIGTIDPSFQVTNEEFLYAINNATEIWGKAWGKPVFVYDPQGEVTINLVFDGRQTLDTKVDELSNQVDEQKNALDPQIAQYQQDVDSFEEKLAEFNRTVQYWNRQGGAPPDAYEELREQQATLQEESRRLRERGAQLNQSTDQFNEQVNSLNNAIGTFNDALAAKPEEGEYVIENGEKTINIYFDIKQNELVHTLAHEMGHALGLDHNNNENSVMYPQTNQVIELSAEDLHDLQLACAKKSVFAIEGEKLALLIDRFRAKVKNNK